MSKNSTALSRLKQDYVRLKRDPIPYISAEPNPSNILEWKVFSRESPRVKVIMMEKGLKIYPRHFLRKGLATKDGSEKTLDPCTIHNIDSRHYIVRGPESSPYYGGLYHGKLKFPAEFPFKPPSIYMITPNGRFKVNTRLCLSISDFHPDTWNPAWSVGTILTGLLSFMVEKHSTLGSLESSESEKKILAYKSIEFNLKDKYVLELFPEIVEEMKQIIATREKNAKQSTKSINDPLNNNIQPQSKYANNSSTVSSVVATFIVAVGFGIFALTVKYVIKSL